MNSQIPNPTSTIALNTRIVAAYGSRADTSSTPTVDAIVAYIRSAVAVPAPALKAAENPFLTPNSRMSMPIGPIGIAIPYPAIMPCKSASEFSGFYSNS